ATVDGPSADIASSQSVAVDVAPDGTAAIAYLKGAGVYVSQLVNGAWSTGQRVDNLATGHAERPDVAVSNGGKIVVVFLNRTDMNPAGIYAVVKPAGQPFPSGAAPLLLPGLTGDNVQVQIAPNGDGYAAFTASAGQIRAAQLTGTTWAPVGGGLMTADGILNSDPTHAAGDSMHEPRVATNGNGSSAVVAWGEYDAAMVSQVFARRLTGTDKGPAPARADLDSFGGADGTGKNADQLDIASDAAGNAWVGFRDNFAYGATDKGRAILRRFVGTAFEPAQLADALGDPPPESIEFPRLAVNAAGQGLMGAYRQMTHSTHAAALDGSIWAPLGDINVTPNPGAAFSVPAIAESGNGLVAWVGADGLVRARVRGNGSLGGEIVLSQPAAGASDVFNLQATADQQNFAVVAFPQGPNGGARIVAAVVDLPRQPTGGGAGGGGAPDTLAPTVSRVRLSRRTFAVGRARTPVAAKLRTGTTISYSLSEAAGVRFKIERTLPGRRSGGRCRKPTKRLRKHRRCTRYRTAGTLRRSGAAGANRLAFSGRIGRRALKRGPYRLTVAAKDAAGNASKAKRANFRIVRAPKRRGRG
ncbi:MAG TPA: hypothetical protein VGF25_00280, partial [Thermoleophilaceae bacterium]